jgi:hypothetical protein
MAARVLTTFCGIVDANGAEKTSRKQPQAKDSCPHFPYTKTWEEFDRSHLKNLTKHKSTH